MTDTQAHDIRIRQWNERMAAVRAQVDVDRLRQSWAGAVTVPEGKPIAEVFDNALENAIEQGTDPANFSTVQLAVEYVSHCFARWFVARWYV